MSNVSTSPSASPVTNDAGKVTPAPVTTGQTGHQQTPSQREPQPQKTTLAPPPDTAVTLAPTLAGFGEGESVAITVLGRDAEGRQIVQALHSILVTLDPEVLPELATATIRVTSIAHDHLRVQLTSVNGETVPTPHTIRLRVVQVFFPQDPIGPNQPSVLSSAGVATLPPVMQVGTVVQTVTTSPPVAVAQNTAAKPISAQATARPPSITVTPAATSGFRIVSAAAPNAPAPSLVTHPPILSVQAAPSTDQLQPTSHALGSVALSGTSLNALVSGVITASPRPNQTVVTTATGKIVLAQPAPTHWPVGTTIVLEVVDILPDGQTAAIAAASVMAANAAARPIDQILMTLGEDWAALRELSKHTVAAAPATAQAFIEGKVPAANARATAQIMFFLSVLRSGDVNGWLGTDMLRSLDRSNQRGLVERLRDDFRQLRRLGDESSGNDWRLLLFPFSQGDRIEPIHMFVRGQRRDQADGDQDVRFVVDLKMSALGALPFDGLLHHQTFDLMVRSYADLSDNQRQDISRIFVDGLESISYRGQIAFQTVKEFPVSPFNDLLGGRHTPGVVLA